MKKKKDDELSGTYLIINGRIKRATKWDLFKHKVQTEIKRWVLVDRYSNKIIPNSELDRYFSLSPIEKETADKLYKEEKRTLSYEFYPCGGICWGVRVHDLKTDEVFDITDVSCW